MVFASPHFCSSLCCVFCVSPLHVAVSLQHKAFGMQALARQQGLFLRSFASASMPTTFRLATTFNCTPFHRTSTTPASSFSPSASSSFSSFSSSTTTSSASAGSSFSLLDEGLKARTAFIDHFNSLQREEIDKKRKVPWSNIHPLFESGKDHDFVKFWAALHEEEQKEPVEALLKKNFIKYSPWEVESMFARALVRLAVYQNFEEALNPEQIVDKRSAELERRVFFHAILLRFISMQQPSVREKSNSGNLHAMYYLPSRAELIALFGLDGSIKSTAAERPKDHLHASTLADHFSQPISAGEVVARITKYGKDPAFNNPSKPISTVWGVHSLSFLSLTDACKIMGMADDCIQMSPLAPGSAAYSKFSQAHASKCPEDLYAANMPASSPPLPIHIFQDYCYHRDMFEVPTKELVKSLSSYLVRRCRELGTKKVVEVGSGHGRLAYFLNNSTDSVLRDAGVSVIASEPYAPVPQRFFAPKSESIQRLYAHQAIKEHKPALVLACWFPAVLELKAAVQIAQHVKEVLMLGSLWHGGQMQLQSLSSFHKGVEISEVAATQLCRYDYRIDSKTGKGFSTCISFRRMDVEEAELM